MALLSCAAPKPSVVAETPQPVKPVETSADAALPTAPAQVDDGIRLPDMLALPTENDLRKVKPADGPAESGAVISRPPVEPVKKP